MSANLDDSGDRSTGPRAALPLWAMLLAIAIPVALALLAAHGGGTAALVLAMVAVVALLAVLAVFVARVIGDEPDGGPREQATSPAGSSSVAPPPRRGRLPGTLAHRH